jgi:hypothetical protein
VVGVGATGWVEFFRANVPEYCGQVA